MVYKVDDPEKVTVSEPWPFYPKSVSLPPCYLLITTHTGQKGLKCLHWPFLCVLAWFLPAVLSTETQGLIRDAKRKGRGTSHPQVRLPLFALQLSTFALPVPTASGPSFYPRRSHLISVSHITLQRPKGTCRQTVCREHPRQLSGVRQLCSVFLRRSRISRGKRGRHWGVTTPTPTTSTTQVRSSIVTEYSCKLSVFKTSKMPVSMTTMDSNKAKPRTGCLILRHSERWGVFFAYRKIGQDVH